MYQYYYNVQLLNQSVVADNLVGEACQRLQSISGAGKSCGRGMPVSTISSKFCTVQVVERPKNLSALWNSKVSAFGSILKYYIISVSISTTSSGCVSKVAAIGRCPLREVPL